MSDWYRLDYDGITPIKVVDGEHNNYDCHKKVVMRTNVKRHNVPEQVLISTVFLGLDHNCYTTGDPLLWETMVFGFEDNDFCQRYSSHKEAIKGHLHTLENVVIKLEVH